MKIAANGRGAPTPLVRRARYSTDMSIIAGLIALFLFDFLLFALYRKMKRGQFNVISNSYRAFRFSTDLGNFAIDRERKRFYYVLDGESGKVPFHQVQNARTVFSEHWAYGKEFITSGFELTDFLGRYRDTDAVYQIVLDVEGGQYIPLFAAQQFQPREFLEGWYIALKQELLESLGWHTDAFAHTEKTMKQIRDAFEQSGVTIPTRHTHKT
ncbi:MAG: hypothetical protein AAF351_15800 [Pseudomonadota bacterium]